MKWKSGDWVRHNGWAGFRGVGQVQSSKKVGRESMVSVQFVNGTEYPCYSNNLKPVDEREALIEQAAWLLLGPQDSVKIVRPPTFGVKP